MSWHRIEKTKPVQVSGSEDEPRYLTNSEIDNLLRDLPATIGSNSLSTELSRYQKIIDLADALRQEKFCPSVIPKLRDQIIFHHQKAMVPPGLPVGSIAASAVSAGATQSNLNSFHHTGTDRNITSGVRIMEEILMTIKKRDNESATIFMEDKIPTVSDALDYESILVGTTLSDLILDEDDVEIGPQDDFETYWWHNAQMVLYGPRSYQYEEDYMMRLHLDQYTMVRRGLTPEEVRQRIYERNGEYVSTKGDYKSSVSLKIYHAPLNEPLNGKIIMDIYADLDPNDDKYAEIMSRKFKSIFILYNIALPIISDAYLSGIPNIKKIYPVKAWLWKVIKTEIPAQPHFFPEDDEELQSLIPRMWLLVYDQGKMDLTGIDFSDIVYLLELIGYETYSIDDDYIYVYSQTQSKVQSQTQSKDQSQAHRQFQKYNLTGWSPPIIDPKKRPGFFVNQIVDQIRNKETAYLHQLYDYRQGLIENEPEPLTEGEQEVIQASRQIYLETAGTDLQNIMNLSMVDRTRTYSNNIFELNEVFGIEFVRSFIIKELYDVTAGGGIYVDPRHIEIIADFLTNRGFPLGINFAGASRGTRGFLSTAFLERANQVLTEGARFGKQEQANSVVASIATGTIIPQGTGSVKVKTDENQIVKLRDKIGARSAKEALSLLETNKHQGSAVHPKLGRLNPMVRSSSSRTVSARTGPGQRQPTKQATVSPMLIESLKNLTISAEVPQEAQLTISTIPAGPIRRDPQEISPQDYDLLKPTYLGWGLPNILADLGVEISILGSAPRQAPSLEDFIQSTSRQLPATVGYNLPPQGSLKT